ncbi:MAG: hypothetical protein FWC02_01480 [Firmicutes bacterium]|nr:hypothetical protein [Bacillota bacterium]
MKNINHKRLHKFDWIKFLCEHDELVMFNHTANLIEIMWKRYKVITKEEFVPSQPIEEFALGYGKEKLIRTKNLEHLFGGGFLSMGISVIGFYIDNKDDDTFVFLDEIKLNVDKEAYNREEPNDVVKLWNEAHIKITGQIEKVSRKLGLDIIPVHKIQNWKKDERLKKLFETKKMVHEQRNDELIAMVDKRRREEAEYVSRIAIPEKQEKALEQKASQIVNLYQANYGEKFCDKLKIKFTRVFKILMHKNWVSFKEFVDYDDGYADLIQSKLFDLFDLYEMGEFDEYELIFQLKDMLEGIRD